jgi:riboflavin biosynthesis pyrimidine reductase
LRVVLGRVPAGARIAPALRIPRRHQRAARRSRRRGVLQLMVEGGADVADSSIDTASSTNMCCTSPRRSWEGDRGRRAFAGEGAPTMDELTRGRSSPIDRLGDDLRIVVVVGR